MRDNARDSRRENIPQTLNGPRPFKLAVVLTLLCSTFFLEALIPQSAYSSPEKSSHSGKEDPKKGKNKAPSKGHSAERKGNDAHGKTTTEVADAQISRKEIDQEPKIEVGTDLVLVLDSSRSMNRSDPSRYRDQGIKLFTRLLGEKDRVAIVTFDREARIVSPFVSISGSTVPDLDTLVSGIVSEGGFTDIAAGVAKALELLQTDGKTSAQKTIVLLTDGKMEPSLSRGTSAQLTNSFKLNELRKLRQLHISLFAISLGANADQTLLDEVTKATGGKHLHAADGASLLRRFSELFISVKAPREPAPDMASVVVPAGSTEASFIIPRSGNEKLSLIDPRGNPIDIATLPPTVRWFSDEKFDLVTINQPISGRWMAIDADGNGDGKSGVKVITELSMELEGVTESAPKGSTIEVTAKLLVGEAPLNSPELAKLSTMTYRVFSRPTGKLLDSGVMEMKTEGATDEPMSTIAGNETSQIEFSAKIPILETGELDLVLALVTPTFSKQYRSGIVAGDGLLKLELQSAAHETHAVDHGSNEHGTSEHGVPEHGEADSGHGKALHDNSEAKHNEAQGEETLKVTLDSSLSALENTVLELAARVPGENSARIFRISENTPLLSSYNIPYASLKLTPGIYRAYVRIIGTNSNGEKIYNGSNVVGLTISAISHEPVVHSAKEKKVISTTKEKEVASEEHSETEELAAAAETEIESSLPGIFSVIGSVIWSAALVYWACFSASTKKAAERDSSSELPDGLAARIGAVREKIGTERRPMAESEKELLGSLTKLIIKTEDLGQSHSTLATGH